MTGKLRKKAENGRWSIFADDGTEITELSSGSSVELKIGDHWVYTTIEHASDYYATTPGVKLQNGLPARKPARR